MGYYMRFFDTSKEPMSMEAIESVLCDIDPRYRIQIDSNTEGKQGELYYDMEPYGEIEINQAGEDLFEAEKQEQIASLADAEEGDAELVIGVLNMAQREVIVRVLFQDRDTEATLMRLDPLWSWLFSARNGLLQADGEGFYNREGLVLSIP
jgi:hypothetical protein